MRIVGVIDIRNGQAVHARGGRRESYAPVSDANGTPVQGDPVALARAYVHRLGVRELYLADLDAIARGPAALDARAVRDIAAFGVPLWVDAGVASVADAHAVLTAGATRVVVGLETLPGFGALDAICAAAGGEAVAFSIDLRDGIPFVTPNADFGDTDPASPVRLAERAALAGVGSIMVLDLARVGTGAGIDAELLTDVRRCSPRAALFAGGGVRDAVDLDRAHRAGCDGVLVATALLSGSIRPA